MNKIIVIITANKYPEGDAGAIRQHSFAKIFYALGYKPLIIGIGNSTSFKKNIYDGIEYYSVRYSHNALFFRVLGRLLFSYHVKKILKTLPVEYVKGIMMVSGGNKLFVEIENFCKKHNIELFHDSVEWYSANEFKKGEKDGHYIANEKLNTIIINKTYKVFSISSYLYNYYYSKNISTLRIPVIMDIGKINHEKVKNGDIIKIVYAGAIGGKDHISEIVEAIALLDEETKRKIQFYIIGCSLKQYEMQFGKVSSELIGKSVFFVNRVPRSVVLDYLKMADFTILLRPETDRYAKAGFPTKVVESLASGTPVICNYTSDLVMYLKDCENAVIVKSCSIEDCAIALRRATQLSAEKRKNMQLSARRTAEENFDWLNYINSIGNFLKKNVFTDDLR